MHYNIPSIDIHGYDSKSAIAIVDSFINGNYNAKYEVISVVHGKGGNVLKEELYKLLRYKKKEVKSFGLNINNIGETIIPLRWI